MEPRKMVPVNLFARQKWRNREHTYGHRERAGADEMRRQSNMETYITMCKIDSPWEFAECLWELTQGLCINLEGWGGEGDGREVQEEGHTYTYGWFMLRFGRKQQNSVKQLSFN